MRVAQAGARVAVCSHDEATPAPALAELEANGEALALHADLAAAADMQRLVEAAESLAEVAEVIAFLLSRPPPS